VTLLSDCTIGTISGHCGDTNYLDHFKIAELTYKQEEAAMGLMGPLGHRPLVD